MKCSHKRNLVQISNNSVYSFSSACSHSLRISHENMKENYTLKYLNIPDYAYI